MVYYSGLDETFAALADPTRRAILERLTDGEHAVSDLAARFPMTLAAVRKHIRVLERARLVSVRHEGRTRFTALRPKPLHRAVTWIDRYRAFWEYQFDQLDAYLASSSQSAGGRRRPRSHGR
ncbi:MAG: ArsR/SmtB family transcription factor [bacterium]